VHLCEPSAVIQVDPTLAARVIGVGTVALLGVFREGEARAPASVAQGLPLIEAEPVVEPERANDLLELE